MQLRDLLANVDVVATRGDLSRGISRVGRDSCEVDRRTLFVAIEGARFDGHQVVDTLADAGAVLVERDVPGPAGVPWVRVRDSRVALARLAAALHGHPARELRVIGLTGTKGKTTTAALVEGALRHAGRLVGRIGTTGATLDGAPLPGGEGLTTPGPVELQATLAAMRDRRATDVVMEVSSIGLDQRRVEGIPFHFAVFTNLGRDHLDYHGTMAAYRVAKRILFQEFLRRPGGPPRAAGWAEDPALEEMGLPADRWTFGTSSGCDFRIEGLRAGGEGLDLRLVTPFGARPLRSALIGRHNALNLVAACAACVNVGLSLEQAVAGLASVNAVPGRMERVPNERGLLLAVDYAHTAESLGAALKTLREVVEGRVWVVFGCGGDRDQGKRPAMGRVAERLADQVVVTSDNPRTEDPQRIIEHVLSGMEKPPAAAVTDRAEAIGWAVEQARAGDAVLVAGKGHETYQEIDGRLLPFDDRVVLRNALG